MTRLSQDASARGVPTLVLLEGVGWRRLTIEAWLCMADDTDRHDLPPAMPWVLPRFCIHIRRFWIDKRRGRWIAG